MESLSDKINAFLSVNSGYGYGSSSGDGSGYGDGWGDGWGCDGWGDGWGCGDGFGFGYGSSSREGSGDGYGSGSGMDYGIASYNGNKVYLIDGVQTIIRQVRDNIAKGFTLSSNLALIPCYIVKEGNTFAHGETLHKAMEALRDKLFEDMPEEERIAAFVEEHKAGVKYPVSDLYDWHHRLTGSCEMGRKAFARDHGIDIERDEMTVEEFIKLTENAYGGETIKKLREAYDQK